MACITTAFRIVSHLKSRDRLLLYTSSSSDPLIVTEDIRARKIKQILDTIGHATAKPKASYLRQSVEVARGILQCGGMDNKHIAVLTCNPFALDKVTINNAIQMHVLSPGPLPWTYSKASANNGWFLLNKPLGFSRSTDVIAIQDIEIQRMLSQLRSSCVSDHLEKVHVTIAPRSQDVLQSILGATFIETMNVGESRTLLVKCNTQPERRTASVLEHFPNGLRTNSGQLDLEREIELMLDHRQIPTIVVKVQYHHSALGSETLCELTKDIFEHSNKVFPGLFSEMDLEQIAMQNRMLYHMATSQPNPRKALEILRSQPYENNIMELTPYIHVLLEELKYQARIQERYMLEKNLILPVLQRYSLFPTSSPSSQKSAKEETSLSDRLSEPSLLVPRRMSAEANRVHHVKPTLPYKKGSRPPRQAQDTISPRKASGAFKYKIRDSALGALRSIGRGQVQNLSSV